MDLDRGWMATNSWRCVNDSFSTTFSM